MWKAAAALALIPTLALAGSAEVDLTGATLPAGAYRLMPDRTRVIFTIDEIGLFPRRGEFTGATGHLTLDPARPEASQLDVSVPISGVSTRDAALDAELKSPTWFDAARYPAMTFRSTAVARTGPASADVTGDLTLRGVTRSVTFKTRFTLAAADPLTHAVAAGFCAQSEIRRSDFGLSRDRPFLSDRVKIVISANFERAGSHTGRGDGGS